MTQEVMPRQSDLWKKYRTKSKQLLLKNSIHSELRSKGKDSLIDRGNKHSK